ncbi:unnamed protein product [Ambrosiozyma monospora]|uniref:Unnamed protein product n=1 Tax=Ambrosiozyma monospora TaxID=43982 RepID=A0ACB5SVQ9_AMBMO|nr:unnamed protein product [Ambrosiozyma monospora]
MHINERDQVITLIDKATQEDEGKSETLNEIAVLLRDPSNRQDERLQQLIPTKLIPLFLSTTNDLKPQVLRALVNCIADTPANRESVYVSQYSSKQSFFQKLNDIISFPDNDDDELLLTFTLHFLTNFTLDMPDAVSFVVNFEEACILKSLIKLLAREDQQDNDLASELITDLILPEKQEQQNEQDGDSVRFQWIELVLETVNDALSKHTTDDLPLASKTFIYILEQATKSESFKLTNEQSQSLVHPLIKLLKATKNDNSQLWLEEKDEDGEEIVSSIGNDDMSVWEKSIYIAMNISSNSGNANADIPTYLELLEEPTPAKNKQDQMSSVNFIVYVMLNNYIMSQTQRDALYNTLCTVDNGSFFNTYIQDLLSVFTTSSNSNVSSKKAKVLIQAIALLNKLLAIEQVANQFEITKFISGLASSGGLLINPLTLLTISKYLTSLQTNKLQMTDAQLAQMYEFISSQPVNYSNYKPINLCGLNLINYLILNLSLSTEKVIDQIHTILKQLDSCRMERMEVDLISEKSKTIGLLLRDENLAREFIQEKWIVKSIEEIGDVVENDQFKRQQQGAVNQLLTNNYKFIKLKLEEFHLANSA